MLSANAATNKRDNFPAVQPRHRQVARRVIWHRARRPGVPLLCAKRDLLRAFKWIDIKPADVSDFGTSLPGAHVDIEGDVRIIYLAMVFGWTGAPGNYMMLALAARDFHERYRPSQPQWHDFTHFRSEWLMDDLAVVEPDLGLRAWTACDALDASVHEVFGAEAVNASEREAEGEPAPTQIACGIVMNFTRERSVLPEPKAMKMRYLLAEPELAFGAGA